MERATEASLPSHWAERVALSYLLLEGYRHLASNYRLRGGELDLVMLDGGTVVVVEVKQRKSAAYGHPAEMLDHRKLARLRATAEHYLAYQHGDHTANARLDAVLVLGTKEKHQIEHLRDIA